VDTPERRVIGSLILLLGLTFFAVGLYTGQLEAVARIVREVFKTALAPLAP